MLYDIDSFGFVCGYISKSWNVMSEGDLLSDRHLARRLFEARYQSWKRHNIVDLVSRYDMISKDSNSFETFCRKIYNGALQEDKEFYGKKLS